LALEFYCQFIGFQITGLIGSPINAHYEAKMPAELIIAASPGFEQALQYWFSALNTKAQNINILNWNTCLFLKSGNSDH
jgi:hypothetical protein